MEFPRMQKKKLTNRNVCCVENCGSKMRTSPNLSFHRIPDYKSKTVTRINLFGNLEQVDKRTEWLKRLKIKNKWNAVLFVCSLHFTKDDYLFPDQYAEKRILKRNAVPIADVNEQKRTTNDRLQRRVQRISKKSSSTELQPSTASQPCPSTTSSQPCPSTLCQPCLRTSSQPEASGDEQKLVALPKQELGTSSEQQQQILYDTEQQLGTLSEHQQKLGTSSEHQQTNFSDLSEHHQTFFSDLEQKNNRT